MNTKRERNRDIERRVQWEVFSFVGKLGNNSGFTLLGRGKVKAPKTYCFRGFGGGREI